MLHALALCIYARVPNNDDVRISSTVMATTNSLLFFADGFLQVKRFLYVFWFVGLNT
jgi:hypothetical protein